MKPTRSIIRRLTSQLPELHAKIEAGIRTLGSLYTPTLDIFTKLRELGYEWGECPECHSSGQAQKIHYGYANCSVEMVKCSHCHKGKTWVKKEGA